jgi:hypothetical protein
MKITDSLLMTLGTLSQLAGPVFVVWQALAVWRHPNRDCVHDGLQHMQQAIGSVKTGAYVSACCHSCKSLNCYRALQPDVM